jgi:hypothetical protein
MASGLERGMMEKVVRKFSSFAEQEAADHRYYASLTPQQRLQIMLELNFGERSGRNDATGRIQKVCRIVKLGEQ